MDFHDVQTITLLLVEGSLCYCITRYHTTKEMLGLIWGLRLEPFPLCPDNNLNKKEWISCKLYYKVPYHKRKTEIILGL